LALRFVGTRAPSVLFYAALGVIPAMVVNALLLWILDPFQAWSSLDWTVYWFLIVYLTWVESPIVMGPLVVFLGASLFRQPMTWRLALKEVAQKLGRQLIVHGLARTHLFWLALVLIGYAGHSEVTFYSFLLIGSLFGSIFWLFRPYIDQIIFLERLTLLEKHDHPMTIRKRSSILHHWDSGGVFIESIVNIVLVAVVFFAVYGLCLWGYYWVTFNTVTQDWFGWSWFALAWWCAMIVATVFRFLGYLDARIRSEGWELDLRVRREAEQQIAAGLGRARPVESSLVGAEGRLGGSAR
jgi:hypothetical protein